jgi:hypothetical protein
LRNGERKQNGFFLGDPLGTSVERLGPERQPGAALLRLIGVSGDEKAVVTASILREQENGSECKHRVSNVSSVHPALVIEAKFMDFRAVDSELNTENAEVIRGPPFLEQRRPRHRRARRTPPITPDNGQSGPVRRPGGSNQNCDICSNSRCVQLVSNSRYVQPQVRDIFYLIKLAIY